MTSRGHFFFKVCVSCQLFHFPFLVTQKCPRDVTINVHEKSPQKCPRKVTQLGDISWTKMSTRCHQKCPRNVTQKMSTRCHPKMSTKCHPKVSTKCHPFCPRDVTFYVHEMSATLNIHKQKLPGEKNEFNDFFLFWTRLFSYAS